MAIWYVNSNRLKKSISDSAKWMLANEQTLNDLNVYPVPDGDTGTNMGATMRSVVEAIDPITENISLGELCSIISRSALMGARGNSGVILSQFFKGFASTIESDQQLLEGQGLLKAFRAAYEHVYKALSNPVEGTILTVLRDSVEETEKSFLKERDVVVILKSLHKSALASLKRTPDLLPVLKEAGVVDSGGLGYVLFLEGILKSINGEVIPKINNDNPSAKLTAKKAVVVDNIYGYCIEFFVFGDASKSAELEDDLKQEGDSIVMVNEPDFIKVHIHAKKPGRILSLAQGYGTLTRIKIDDMDEQSHDVEHAKIDKTLALISVVNGQGYADIFQSLGCDTCIVCKESMNPSVNELNAQIHHYNAQEYIILPNNKNVFLTAQQVKDLNPTKKIHVLETKNLQQGLSSMLSFNIEHGIEKNLHSMTSAIQNVKSAEIIKATQNRRINDVDIQAGKYFSIFEGKVLFADDSSLEVAKDLLKRILSDEDEVVSIYHSKEPNASELEVLELNLSNEFEDLEVEIYNGGQAYESYAIAIE